MGSSLFFALGASYQDRVANHILRLRELVTIISKQVVIIPQQKLGALLS